MQAPLFYNNILALTIELCLIVIKAVDSLSALFHPPLLLAAAFIFLSPIGDIDVVSQFRAKLYK
mgnify:CR=1 FL=1